MSHVAPDCVDDDGVVAAIEACCQQTNENLVAVIDHVDGLEALIGTTNTKLDSLVVLNQPTATFSHDQLDVTTVAVQLPSNVALRGFILKALKDNSADIYIGNSSGVTTLTGFPLAASETISLPDDDTSDAWAISASGTQRLSWLVN